MWYKKFTEEFRDEQTRLDSFKGWISPHVTKEDLAMNGFYYTSISDNARCYYCGVEISDWVNGDSVGEEHRKHSPYCEIVKGEYVENYPIDGKAWKKVRSGNSEIYHRSSLLESKQPTIFHPRHEAMSSPERRLKTFALWPSSLNSLVEDLKKSGFYYTNFGDNVKCFSCCGEVSDFNALDKPMERHAALYPECQFVNLMMGQDFVKQVLSKPSSQDVKAQTPDSFKSNKDPCQLCCTNEKNTLFLPCLHSSVCSTCCQSMTHCNFCGEAFESVKRIMTV